MKEIVSSSIVLNEPFNGELKNQWLPESVTNAKHHAMKAISASQLKYFKDKSGYGWLHKYVLKDVKEQKPEQKFAIGTLIHSTVLEPELFKKQYITINEDKRTKKFEELLTDLLGYDKPEPKKKKKKDEQTSVEMKPDEVLLADIEWKEYKQPNLTQDKQGMYTKANGEKVYCITEDELDDIVNAANSIKNDELAIKLLSNGVAEQSGIAQDPETGLWLCIRGDWRFSSGFYDLKSIVELTKSSIRYHIETYKYWLQAAHYLHVANLIEPDKYKHFIFGFVEKQAPYEVVNVSLSEQSMRKAKECYRRYLNDLASQIKNREFVGCGDPFEGGGIVMDLRPWAFD